MIFTNILQKILKQDLTLKKFERDRQKKKKEKHKKVIELMKDELFAQIMKIFVGLRAKTYSYLKDKSDEHKKGKGTRLKKLLRSTSNWK